MPKPSTCFFYITLLALLSLAAEEPLKFKPNDMKLISLMDVEEKESAPWVKKLAAYHATTPFYQTKEEFKNNPNAYFTKRLAALEALIASLDAEKPSSLISSLRQQAENKKKYIEALPDILDPIATKSTFFGAEIIKALAIKDSNKLEALDPLHRLGESMEVLRNRWIISSIPNYFIYLETVEDEPLVSKYLPQRHQVQYFHTAEERIPHRLSFKNGLIYHQGKPFDTNSFETRTLGKGSALFVMGLDGEFYVNNHIQYKMHHSSEFAGEEVLTAGQMIAKDGKVVSIDNKSGHYAPNLEEMLLTLETLKQRVGSIQNIEAHIIFVKGSENLAIKAFYDAEKLLETRGHLLPKRAQFGWTPLHIAVWRNQTFLASEAISLCDIDAQNTPGSTALHIAVSNNYRQWIDILLQNGASTRLLSEDGLSPFHLAISKGNFKVVQQLFPYATLQGLTAAGDSPLFLAAESYSLATLNFLLENGCDPHHLNSEGNTLLHSAAKSLNHSIWQALTARYPEKQAAQNYVGATPLHMAAAFNSLENFLAMLKETPDTPFTDLEGNTFLHYATKYGNEQVIRGLIEDEKFTWMCNIQNNKGQLPLHLATKAPISIDNFSQIIDATANINTPDALGESPLFYAIENKKNYHLLSLLEHGARTHIPNHQGIYPAQKSCSSPFFSIHALLSYSDDLNLCDNEGNSLLHIALMNENTATASYLLPYFSEDKRLEKNLKGVSCIDLMKNHKNALFRAEADLP